MLVKVNILMQNHSLQKRHHINLKCSCHFISNMSCTEGVNSNNGEVVNATFWFANMDNQVSSLTPPPECKSH